MKPSIIVVCGAARDLMDGGSFSDLLLVPRSYHLVGFGSAMLCVGCVTPPIGFRSPTKEIHADRRIYRRDGS